MAWSWIHSGKELRALAGQGAYAQTIADMRGRVDYWKARFEDSPARKTGWMHNYVCPVCATFLTYDPDKPEEHVCPACGAVAENTAKVLEAWTYMRRYEIVNTLPEAAFLYVMDGQADDRDFILRVIDFYATHYVEFTEYGVYAGRGRIMGQSLDEAVWGVTALRALMTIGFDGQSEQGQRWYHLLFLPMSRLVVAQTGMIHNIPLWHATCAFCSGLFFGDEWLVRNTLGGELGLSNQILKGFTADGVWYENSTGYHYYSLMAATNVCLFARWAGIQDRLGDLFARVIEGYTALLRLRFADGSLPAFNDSSRQGCDEGIAGYLPLYLQGARLFGGMPGAQAIGAAISGYAVEGSEGAFLFGIPPRAEAAAAPASANLPHNCLAMLRDGGLEVFCKYGNLTRSHAHPDALEICFPPFASDLGNPGYGSPFHRGWFTQTLSHNTFLIDGASQRSDARGTGVLSADGKSLALKIGDAYEGVCATRDLTLDGGVLTDAMDIRCEAEHTIDWVFHSEGEAAFTGSFTDATLPETENGYGYLTDVRRAEGPFAATFTREGKSVTLAFASLPEGAALYLAKSPNNPANLQRHTVLVRTRARAARVEASFTFAD